MAIPPLDPFATPATPVEEPPRPGPPPDSERDLEREVELERFAGWLLAAASLVWTSTLFALDHGAALGIGAAGLASSVLLGVAGWRLRALEPASRTMAASAAVLLLPLFPIGSYLGVRGLVALLERRGARVLSDAHDALRQRDRFRPRTPWDLALGPILSAVLGGILA